MTPRARVRRARIVLVTAAVVTALARGLTAGVVVLAVALIARATRVLPLVTGGIVLPATLLAISATCAIALWRARAAWSLTRIALWVEERRPAVRYVLVTAVDPRLALADPDSPVIIAANAVDIEAVVRAAVARTVARAVVWCALATAVLALLQPRRALREMLSATASSARGSGTPTGLPNRLGRLSVRVDPPAYARMPARTLREPSNVAALVGSRLTLMGDGRSAGISGTLGDTVHVAHDGRDGGWAIQVAMPSAPVALRLRDRAYERLVALEPVIDSAPRVTLILPERDTTYRTPPTGRLVITAQATDDIGLDFGYIEILLSSGSEENFHTETRLGPRVALGNARAAGLRMVLDFDSLHLGPGSILHIRAVAVDGNTVTGPGRGFSETRTLRVATPQEYDSVDVAAAPPMPIDTLFMSQRMLNMRTDTLIGSLPRLTRHDLVDRSTGYSDAQETIRERVEGVIALLEDDGVGGRATTAESMILHDASEQMFEARGLLGVAEPRNAMPYMKKALALLEQARAAHRYYLRGILRPNVVNLARIRLQGKDTAAAGPRLPRERLDDPRAGLRARLDFAMRLVAGARAAAIDSLTMIRLTTLAQAPAAAAPLEQAIEALRANASADASANASTRLLGAWRLLAPPTRFDTAPSAWSGGEAW